MLNFKERGWLNYYHEKGIFSLKEKFSETAKLILNAGAYKATEHFNFCCNGRETC